MSFKGLRYFVLCFCITDPVVQITDDGKGPLTGKNYTLMCNVMGNINLTYTYQWRRNGALLPQIGPILLFSSLQLFDAGQYMCETIGDINAMSDIFNVTLQGKQYHKIHEPWIINHNNITTKFLLQFPLQ